MKFKKTALFVLTSALLISLCACGGDDRVNESDLPATTVTAPAQGTIEPVIPQISDADAPTTSEGNTGTNPLSQEEQEISSERVGLDVLSETRDWIMGLTEEVLASLKYDDVVAYIGCEPSTLQVSGEDFQIYQWKADGAEDNVLKVSFKLTDGNWLYFDSMLYV